MSLDPTAFIARFPEFKAVDTAYLTLKLAEANAQIDRKLWDDPVFVSPLGDIGQGYKTAHLLALSPFGNAAAMVAKDGTTTYGKFFAELVRTVTAGLRST